MTYGTNDKGQVILTLEGNEAVQFKAGVKVVKTIGSSQGMGKIVMQMTYPKLHKDRFPEEFYGKNYRLPK
jgi:hypothetical protein